MRTHVLSCVVLGSVLLTACISPTEPGGEEATGESQEALIRGGLTPPPPTTIYEPPPPPPPDPDPLPDPRLPVVPIGPIKGTEPTPTCDPVRFDLRRASRTCENLPGAYVEGGVTYVPGTNGRFRVGRLLAGTDAPAFIQARACSFVWQPSGCANPDTAKLLVEQNESLQKRPASCLDDPASCGVDAIETSPARYIPSGTGRCDVCGYASSNYLWVVLPADWSGFQFSISGGSPQYVSVPDDQQPSVVQVPLSSYVSAPQTVSLIRY